MSTPAHSLSSLQLRAALFCRGTARVLLVVVMLLGLAGQILLTAASLPEESPRAAILRLTGLDIAPSPMPAAMQADAHASTGPTQKAMAEDAPCPDQGTLSSPQTATPHTNPAATPDAENEHAGTIGTHHGMRHISTVQNVAPAPGHTTAHAVYHGVHHHSHHHGLDCPLCPLLGHVIFVLACLSALLSHERLTRRLWQDRTPSRAPPETPYQHPPSRGPPHTILTCIIA